MSKQNFSTFSVSPGQGDEGELHRQYVNAIRKQLLSRLKNNWVVSSSFYDAQQGGGMVHFRIAPGQQITDPPPRHVGTMTEALDQIIQWELPEKTFAPSALKTLEAFRKRLKEATYSDTDVLLIGDSIILAKSSENPQIWSEEASKKDAAQIISYATK